MTTTRSAPAGVGLPPPRPDGTLHDAIAVGDQAAIRAWALYYEYENSVGMSSVLGLCRTVEEIDRLRRLRGFKPSWTIHVAASALKMQPRDVAHRLGFHPGYLDRIGASGAAA